MRARALLDNDVLPTGYADARSAVRRRLSKRKDIIPERQFFANIKHVRILLSQLRHGCGGRPSRAELLTGIDGVSGRPVRRIVLLSG